MKSFFYLLVLMFACNDLHAQRFVSFNINRKTERLQVKTNTAGKDFIMISLESWEQVAFATRYSFLGSRMVYKRKLHVEIADKTNGLCNRGIGLGCSMFDCAGRDCAKQLVNGTMRLSCVSTMRVRDTVMLIFNNKVDWDDLNSTR